MPSIPGIFQSMSTSSYGSVGDELRQLVEPLLAGGGQRDLEGERLQHSLQDLAGGGVVVHHQHPHAAQVRRRAGAGLLASPGAVRTAP